MKNKLSMMLFIASISAASFFTMNVQAMAHIKCNAMGSGWMCCGSPTGDIEDFDCHFVEGD